MMMPTGLSADLTKALVFLAKTSAEAADSVEAALAHSIVTSLDQQIPPAPTPALESIATFEWNSSGLRVARLAQKHLGSHDECVRTHAALAVLRSIEVPGHRKRGSQKELVASVVEHVLVVAVSDPAPMLRATLLHTLSSRGCFLSVLKRPQLVRLLATVLNDGSMQVRRAVIPLLGQLAPLNPSVVMGSLQKSIKWLIQVPYHTAIHSNKHTRMLS